MRRLSNAISNIFQIRRPKPRPKLTRITSILGFEPLEDRRMLASTADIVFLVDESNSTTDDHLWLADVVSQLDSELGTNGITDNRYGLVAFGNALNADFAHSHLMNGSLFGNVNQVSTAISGIVLNGGDEDGWDAIEHAVAEYDFRPGAAVNFVLL